MNNLPKNINGYTQHQSVTDPLGPRKYFDKTETDVLLLPDLHKVLAANRSKKEKSLANEACNLSPAVNKDTRQTHIVLIHLHNPYYLKFSLAQARISNPNARIHLIGDESNNVYDFIEHHDISQYAQSALEFAKHYKHLSITPFYSRLISFQRWFILNEFVKANNIDRFLYLDSDVMAYCDVAVEFEKFSRFDFTLSQSACPHDIFWNNMQALNAFCKFLMDVYTGHDPEIYEKLLKTYEHFFRRKANGGVCDMTLFGHFRQIGNFKISDVDVLIDNTTYDHNINASKNDNVEFQMEDDIKKIDWIDNCPYGTTLTGEKIKFNILHCQGGAKKYMETFYRGKKSDDELLAIELLNKGWENIKNGNMQQAMDFLDKATPLCPFLPNLNYLKAIIYGQTGQLHLAKAACEAE